LIDNIKGIEKAVIVAVKLQNDDQSAIEESLKELESLLDTAGAVVVGSFIQNKQSIDPVFYVGKGKVDQIKAFAEQEEATTIVFDTELSPSQIKNLEKVIEKKILDRSWVILDIFARNAKSKEAKTQVELAQMKYFLPRLTRQWTHLSRQVGGGVGTKGPGETQLETDKRLVRKRILLLEEELKEISKQRKVQRKQRDDLFKVVLVGYTNVGKSSLMNKISVSDVFVENRLFATLDSTTRVVEVENKKPFLLSDTVGFINKLPHNLIASFRSTLEEVVEADLLLHVVDISHPNFEEQIRVAEKVLKELDVLSKPKIFVFNKYDLLDSKSDVYKIYESEDYVYTSALTDLNIETLKQKIAGYMESEYVSKEIECHVKEYKIISLIHELTDVLKEEYIDDKILIAFKGKKADVDLIDSKLLSLR